MERSKPVRVVTLQSPEVPNELFHLALHGVPVGHFIFVVLHQILVAVEHISLIPPGHLPEWPDRAREENSGS